MASLAQLWVEFRASTDKFNADLRAAQRETREFEKQVKPTTKALDDFGGAALKAGTVLTASLTAPIAAIAGLGIQFNAMKEQAQIAFTTMLGSGEKATVFLKDLQDFAAKTPFEFPDLVRGSQRLMAMGFAAKDVKPLLTIVGDAMAGLGRGSEGIDRVTLALGQIQQKGRLMTQEMNQLTEAGINGWKYVAEAVGVSESKLRDMVEKGLIPGGAAVKAITEGMARDFGGMMEKQSQTFTGLVSTIKDESRFIAGELTTGLFSAIKGPLEVVTKAMHALRESMSGWSDSTKATILVVALLAAAIGPLLVVLGTMALSVSSLIILYGQLSVAGGLLAASFANLGIFAAVKSFADLRIAMALVVEQSVILKAAMAALPWAVVIAGIAATIKLAYDLYQTIQNNIEATRNLDTAEAQQRQNVLKSIQNLKALGIEYSTAGKSIELQQMQVRELTQSYYREHPAVRAVTEAHRKNEFQIAEEAAAYKKLSEIKFNAQQDSYRETVKAESDLRDLLDRQLEYHTKTYEAETKAKIDSINAQIKAMDELERIIFDAGQRSVRIARDAEDEMRSNLDSSLEYHSRVYEEDAKNRQDSREKVLSEIKKAEEEAAESTRRVWEQATANITSDFVKGLSDVIFHAKNFGQAMKDIALNTAESMFQAFMTGLFSPLTSAMGRLGKGFADVLMGSGGISGVIGKLGGLLGIGSGTAGLGTTAEALQGLGLGGGAAGAGAAAGGVGIGGLGASMAAFATNPITLAVAGAIAAGLAIHHFVGRGRRTANEFVQGTENPFGKSLGALVDSFDSAKAAGSLTLDEAKQSRDAVFQLWQSFVASAEDFAKQGSTEAKVVEQSFAHLSEIFGPNLSKIFQGMDATIADLQKTTSDAVDDIAEVTSVDGSTTSRFSESVDRLIKAFDGWVESLQAIRKTLSGVMTEAKPADVSLPPAARIPQTGRAQSASEIFAGAVAEIVPAFGLFAESVKAIPPRGETAVTIHNDFSPQFTFYGVPESLETAIREQIEPKLMEDLQNNTRGITAALIAILRNNEGGVSGTVPVVT